LRPPNFTVRVGSPAVAISSRASPGSSERLSDG